MCLAGCGWSAPPDVADAERVPMTVWIAGCNGGFDGRCALRDRDHVEVWYEAGPEEDGVFTAGSESVPTSWRAQDGVHWARVPVAAGTKVALEGDPWSLDIVAAVEVEGLREALSLEGQAFEDEMARLMEANSGPARARVLAKWARHRTVADRRALLEQSTALYIEHGDVMAEVRNRMLAAFGRIQEGDGLTAARVMLAPLDDRVLPEVAEIHAWIAWVRGTLDVRVGRFGAALEHHRQWVQLSELQGDARSVADARSELAHLAQRVGRHEEALDAHRALLVDLPDDAESCQASRYLNNYAWALIVAGERGVDIELSEALTRLDEAESRLVDGCPGGASLLADIQLNRAVGLLQRSPRAAAESLESFTPEQPTLWQRIVRSRVRAQASLEASPEEALASFAHMRTLAEEAGRLPDVWRALHGEARALEGLGRFDEALERYAASDALASSSAAFVPITLGRDAFLAERDLAARHRVALLLQMNRAAEAMAVVRQLRREFLASLRQARALEDLSPADQARWEGLVSEYETLRDEREQRARDAWQVPEENKAEHSSELRRLERRTRELMDEALSIVGGARQTLRSPDEGEVMLSWFEDRQGLVGFSATHDDVLAIRLPMVAPTDSPMVLASSLLAPLAPRAADATRVTMLPYGWVRGVDLQALPWRETSLGAWKPVSWSLDLAPSSATLSAATSAVVVGDPRGDLPWARKEARSVAESLGGLSVISLSGDGATRDALVDALPAADLFHFAGHGAFGEGVWDGELLTAREGRLSVADVLSLPSVPARVVLSGCETARTKETALENLGLAQAFVTAGSSVSVASARTVDDRLAAAFVDALYEADFATRDPAEAFAAASVAVSTSMPDADVGAFRLIIP